MFTVLQLYEAKEIITQKNIFPSIMRQVYQEDLHVLIDGVVFRDVKYDIIIFIIMLVGIL